MSEQHIEKLLSFLGVPSEYKDSRYCCPLHAKPTFSLFFIECNILPGGYHVKCDDPKCGFSGTVFELMAESAKKPLTEIIYLFMPPDGEFYDTFIPKGGSTSAYRSELMGGLGLISVNRDMRNYLGKCRQELLFSAPLRAALTGYGIQETMFEKLTVGKYVKHELPDSVPPSSVKDSKEDRFVFPYTCRGLIVDLQIVNPKARAREHYTLNDDKAHAGIFQEEHLSGEGVINVCQDELSAMLLSSKVNEHTNKPSNAVFLVSNRSTRYLPDGQPIQLVSTSDNKLQLDRAVHFWKKRSERKVLVSEIPGRMTEFSGHRLSLILKTPSPVEEWIVEKILEINSTKSSSELKSIISSLSLSLEDKSELISLLSESGKADPILLSIVKDARTSESRIVYGKFVFRRGEQSYTEGRGHINKLSNCAFYADAVTKDDAGNKVVIGRVRTDIPDEPLYRVSLATKSLLTHKGAPVGEMIWSQLVEQGSGYKPYLADLYGGPTWYNILTGFDDAPYIDSMLGLGLHGDKVINFPNARVDMEVGTVTDGHFMSICNKDAACFYSQVLCGDYEEDLLRKLVETDNKIVRYTIMVLCHVLHQIATSSVAKERYVAKHLVLPYAVDDDIMYNACIQAYYVLSGRLRPPVTPEAANKFGAFSKTNDSLGTLPGIYNCRLSKPLRDYLYSSSNSVVLLTSCIDTMPFSRERFTYFMSSNEPEVMSRDYIDEDVANILRAAIPHLILKFIRRVNVKSDCGPNVKPAEKGFRWLQEELGTSVSTSDVNIDLNYMVSGTDSLDVFLSVLAENVLGNRAMLAPSLMRYRKETAKYVGYQSGDNLYLKVGKCIEVMGTLGGVFSYKQIVETADRAAGGELKIPMAKWKVHYAPATGKALTMGDLRLVNVS